MRQTFHLVSQKARALRLVRREERRKEEDEEEEEGEGEDKNQGMFCLEIMGILNF